MKEVTLSESYRSSVVSYCLTRQGMRKCYLNERDSVGTYSEAFRMYDVDSKYVGGTKPLLIHGWLYAAYSESTLDVRLTKVISLSC